METGKRIYALDEIRGITLCSMILYHAVWDLVYMFGLDWDWYRSDIGFFWQQSICWSFILLSGFCFCIGKRKWRRGMIVFSAGIVISLVTEIVMPQNRVRYGVLTFLGSSMLFLAAVEAVAGQCMRWKQRIWKQKEDSEDCILSGKWRRSLTHSKGKLRNAVAAELISLIVFLLTKKINRGYLSLFSVPLLNLPKAWYCSGEIGNFLGFTQKDFFSTDYFSFFPWFFLFLAGYFLFRILEAGDWLHKLWEYKSPGKIWRLPGRYSLPIYMIHQPILYGFFCVFDWIGFV